MRRQYAAMTRHIVAVLLTGILSGHGYGQTQPSKHATPIEQVGAIPANSAVEVKLVAGAPRRGLISDVSSTGFVLSQEVHHQMTKTELTFVQVTSVKQIASVKPSHTTRNILIVVAIAAFAMLAYVGSHV
jgi:hypothetical protein